MEHLGFMLQIPVLQITVARFCLASLRAASNFKVDMKISGIDVALFWTVSVDGGGPRIESFHAIG